MPAILDQFDAIFGSRRGHPGEDIGDETPSKDALERGSLPQGAQKVLILAASIETYPIVQLQAEPIAARALATSHLSHETLLLAQSLAREAVVRATGEDPDGERLVYDALMAELAQDDITPRAYEDLQRNWLLASGQRKPVAIREEFAS